MAERVPFISPPITLLCKLGSIAVHADEITEAGGVGGHEFDVIAIRSLLADPEVSDWITAMGGFLPVKRVRGFAK